MPKGLMIGPVSGKLLAQLIDGEVPDVDLMPFDPARCFRRLGRRRLARLAARAVGNVSDGVDARLFATVRWGA